MRTICGGWLASRCRRAAHQEIEFLVGAAEFDVRFQRDGVVALRDGVEEFVQADGLFCSEALVEVFALEHLGQRGFCGKADDVSVAEWVEPLGVEADFSFVAIEDAEDLRGVGLGVARDFFLAERLARGGAAGGIADEGGGVADKKDDGVAERLEVLELAHEYGVAEVEVGGGGIEAGFDAERGAGFARGFEAGAEVGLGDDFGGAFFQEIKLLVDWEEGGHGFG